MKKDTTLKNYYGCDYQSRLTAISILGQAITWIKSLDNDTLCPDKPVTNDLDALKLIEIAIGNRNS